MTLLELGLVALSVFLSIFIVRLKTGLGNEETRVSSLEKQVYFFSDKCNALQRQLDTQIAERTGQVAFEQQAHAATREKLESAYAENEVLSHKLSVIKGVFVGS
jgi:hypothetical protein